MNISVIGTGYAGLASAVGFALKGHNVICMDIDDKVIASIRSGRAPIFEPGLDEAIQSVIGEGRLEATTNLGHAIASSEVSFVCVPTPSLKDGSIDLKFIEHVSRDIGKCLKDSTKYHVVAIKSTVIPETTEKVVIPLLAEHSGKKPGQDFGVGMVPEFLREGSALQDVLEPDRIVIGELDKRSGDVLEQVHKPFGAQTIRTALKVAELVKYASNAFLATKVSFANEIGNISKTLGIDVYEVMKGVGLDKRISPHFLRAGVGFGGSCFPKDVIALIQKGHSVGYQPALLEEVLNLNKRQPLRLVELLKARLGPLKGREVAVIGLSFKANTDDIRESPAIAVVSELVKLGARVRAFDPKSSGGFKEIFPKITYYPNVRDAVRSADACLVLTDWPEFRDLTDQDFSGMKNRLIIEGRRTLNPHKVSDIEGICW
jgi:UDPglucose 6-dehydrogenase